MPAPSSRLPWRIGRAVILGLLIAAVSTLVHSAHGHAPSATLAVITSIAVVLACLPLGATPLRRGSVFALMVVGELALHAWFAWFSMPATGLASSTTATLHHGAHVTATLAPRDFSVLMPSPMMLAAHVAAAVVLAWLVTRADALALCAASLFGSWGLRLPAVPHIAVPERRDSEWARPVRPIATILAFSLSRRGPPTALAV